MRLPFENNASELATLISHWEALRRQAHIAAVQTTTMGVADTIQLATHESAREIQRSGELLLQTQIVILGDKTNEGHLIQAVAIPWFEIIRGLERDPDFIFQLKPRQLEELIAGAYMQAGCTDIILTPGSGDKGRDVIVTASYPGIGEVRFVDQVKRYATHHLVKADEVRALLGVLDRDKDVSKGIITTTSDFAPGISKELADYIPTRLALKNGDQLKAWLLELCNKNQS